MPKIIAKLLRTLNDEPQIIPVPACTPIILHGKYADYPGYILDANPITGRAFVEVWDDVLDGGCMRQAWIWLHDISVVR